MVIPNNNNMISLNCKITSADPFDFQKCKLLEKFGFLINLENKDNVGVKIKASSTEKTKLLITSSLLPSRTKEIITILCANNEHELTNTNEVKFYKFYRRLCRCNLENWTNINLEALKIARSKIPSNYWYILEGLNEHKNILNKHIQFCNERLTNLIS